MGTRKLTIELMTNGDRPMVRMTLIRMFRSIGIWAIWTESMHLIDLHYELH